MSDGTDGQTQGPRYFEWRWHTFGEPPRKLAAQLLRSDTPTGLAPGINVMSDLDTWTRNRLSKAVQNGELVVTVTGRAWLEGSPIPLPVPDFG